MRVMVDAIIAGAVIVAVVVGLWLTRNAKGPGGPPGSPVRDAELDRIANSLGREEAFRDNKPDDY
jgi:hypothetical protein